MTSAFAPTESMPVTRLLKAWNDGERGAHEALIAAVYARLRAIARRQLEAERGNHTLQPTAVVHEAYARLVGSDTIDWHDRRHFFAVATTMMRRILVDHARARLAAKRGGPEVFPSCGRSPRDRSFPDRSTSGRSGRDRSPADETPRNPDLGELHPERLLAIDLALTRLHAIDPSKSQLVALRFFGGFSLEETAQLLGCSRGTVVRQWRVARAWLFHELGGGVSP